MEQVFADMRLPWYVSGVTSAIQTQIGNKVGTARTISTTAPLSGGGDLSADRSLSIANAMADGSTKGAAAFNATNFSASSGVVNTIQDISTAATPQFTRLGLGAAASSVNLLTVTQPVATSGSPIAMVLSGGAHTTLAASTEASDISFNFARTVQFSTGALTTQRAVLVQSPTYGFVGSSTLTTAATLAISGAPTAGTNATITNPYALWVQGGVTKLDGSLELSTGSATARTAPIKFTSGTAETTARAGAVEYDGQFLATPSSGNRVPILGGALFDHFASVGNVGTGEDDLYSDTLPANILNTNGDAIEANYGGTFALHATATRNLKVYFDGTLLMQTGARTTTAGGYWSIHVLIIRVSSTVIRAVCTVTANGMSPLSYALASEVTGKTLSNTNVLKVTGEAAAAGAASNDIVALLGKVRYLAAA